MARKVDWRLELALIVAHETGHRIRAIRHLRWSDVDFSKDLIRWRGEVDKIGREHLTPLTEGAMEVLRRAQKERAAIGEAWAFFLPHQTSQSRYLGI